MKILGEQPLPEDTNQPSDRPGKPWRFLLVVTLLLTGLAFAVHYRTSSGHDKVKWRYSYNQAVIESEETGRPLLVMFTADWCGPCKQMKAFVFSDNGIAKTIDEMFVPVKVDLSSEGLPDQHLADRYGIQAIPTLLTLTSDGQSISASSGYMTKDELLAWMDTATERYAMMLKMQALAPESATVYVGDDEHD